MLAVEACRPALRALMVLDNDWEQAAVLDGNFEENWGDCLYLQPILHHGKKERHVLYLEILDDKTENATPFYLMSLIIA